MAGSSGSREPSDPFVRRIERLLDDSRALARALRLEPAQSRSLIRQTRHLALEIDALAAALRAAIDVASSRPTEAPLEVKAALLEPCGVSGKPRLRSDHETVAVEVLAQLAAQLGGRDPHERVTLQYGEVVAFDDAVWRYPDFQEKAVRAYAELAP